MFVCIETTICIVLKKNKKTTRYGKESLIEIQKLGIARIKKEKVGDKNERR